MNSFYADQPYNYSTYQSAEEARVIMAQMISNQSLEEAYKKNTNNINTIIIKDNK